MFITLDFRTTSVLRHCNNNNIIDTTFNIYFSRNHDFNNIQRFMVRVETLLYIVELYTNKFVLKQRTSLKLYKILCYIILYDK